MSRIPRLQEYLKTAFTGEAASAARFRAYAEQAERDGLPNVAKAWSRLAGAKDRLAMALLEAAGEVRGRDTDLARAVSEERFENDVLYPKMIKDLGEPGADVLLKVVSAQKDHLRQMEALRDALDAAPGDVSLPVEVEKGATGNTGAARS